MVIVYLYQCYVMVNEIIDWWIFTDTCSAIDHHEPAPIQTPSNVCFNNRDSENK